MNGSLRQEKQRGAVAATVVALLIGALVAIPVMADGNGSTPQATSVSVSLDGITFTQQHTDSVFHPDLRIIPGGSYSSTVWVRNDAATEGRLRLDVIPGTTSDQELADHLSFAIGQSTRPAGNYWSTSFKDAYTCSAIANDIVLDAGETISLDIVASLGLLEETQGHRATVEVGFRVFLVEATAPQSQNRRDCMMDVPGRGPEPTPTFSPDPSGRPTPEPTPDPSSRPTPEPSHQPTPDPSVQPSPPVTESPTPTPVPSSHPDPSGSVSPAQPSATDAPGTDASDEGAMPTTGASIQPILIVAALLIAAGGIFLVVIRRKNGDDD